MVTFGKERAIVQRYISLLPVFQAPLDDKAWVHGPAVSAEPAVVAERLKPLVRLYGMLEEAAAKEVRPPAAPHLRTCQAQHRCTSHILTCTCHMPYV
jgi:hypothetical protein